MLRRALPALAAVAVGLTAVACGSSSGDTTSSGGGATATSANASGGGFKLGFSSYPPIVPVISLAVQGAKDAAKGKGIDVAFAHADDAAGQQTAVQNLLAGGADILAIDPNDSTAIGTSVKQANDQGVPVIMWIGNNLGAGNVSAFISSSEEQGGRTLGEYVVKQLGGKGKVAFVNGDKAQQGFNLREKGFRAALNGTGVKIAAYGNIEAVADKAYDITTNMLAKDSGLTAVVTTTDAMADGAYRAVSKSSAANKPKVIGYNGDCPTLQSIWKGGISGTVYQGWYEIGRRLVGVASQLHSGKKVQPTIVVPPFVINKAVMQQVQDGSYAGLKQDPYLKTSVAQAIGGCKGLS
jgi:ribose transport system permease protein